MKLRTLRLLLVGLAIVASKATPAADLTISSFSPDGRLTFQQVPFAGSYEVQWTTNLLTWNSTPPGVIGILPTGVGSLTTTVGVIQAWCFYRVVASVTNLPPGAITNTFDLSNEGWAIVSYPFRSHVANPETTSLPFDALFGNPAGSVRVGDIYGETGISAPSQYLGNALPFYGGAFAYDIQIRYTDAVAYPAVVMNGGTISLYYDAPAPPLNAWQRRTVPFSETGWKVSGTGADASQSVFKSVLGNLVGLYIYTEWRTGPDDTSVDNITLTPP